MTPEQIAQTVRDYGGATERMYGWLVKAIHAAENEALEQAAEVADNETSKTPIVAPLADAAWDKCARTIATAIRALKGGS